MTDSAVWTRVGSLVRLNTTLLLREPGPVISRLLMPLILIAVLHPLYRAALSGSGAAAGTTQIVAGMLVMFSLLALSIVGSAILTERVWRTWDRLRVTPAAAWELIAGKVVPSFVILVLQQVLILAFGALLFGLPVRDILLLAAAVGLWVVTLLCIGTALGTLARSHSELAVLYDIGGLALTVLGGALVPLSLMPDWARMAAPLSPGYWAMSAFRYALEGDVTAMMRANGVLLSLAVVFGAVASWRIRRGWGRSHLL
ncbi:ABC transporter permease [Plantactinospora sp. S1510]|uniref:Transport permease protein n=1 Tax=Plantactinospora alkalitolerans TaxID=2789879 RepID=A0ABS0H2Y3_9ACTN|nr:ABC transporter permease [Plantactinospora alkalitolerans]MBF9132814.1 ABC transporter permease [Plantactinospora alkalitolerans]